jgi:flagellar biosynthetic protein FlhB
MAGDTHQEDRSEAATPRRLQKAREEGQVPVSRELVGFAALAAVTLTLLVAAPNMVHESMMRLSVFLARSHDLTPGTACSASPGWHGGTVRHPSHWRRCWQER